MQSSCSVRCATIKETVIERESKDTNRICALRVPSFFLTTERGLEVLVGDGNVHIAPHNLLLEMQLEVAKC